MNCAATRHDLERFRDAIARRIGLQFDDTRLSFLGDVLQRRLDRLGCPADAYVWELERQESAGEVTLLAQELTVGETYFFRNNDQFRAFAENVLPNRMAAATASVGNPKTLRVLSAGCASGEEAYSLAIAARHVIADSSWEVAIRAVDINPAALERARQARYSAWALRDTPPDIRSRWFRPDGRDMVLDDTARAAVKFEVANLAGDDPALWQPAAYDVVFCRNVLMYFSPAQMRATVARIAKSLAPGGFLFLGHAETLRGISDAFQLCHSHATFYYRHQEHGGYADRDPGDPGRPLTPGSVSPAAPRSGPPGEAPAVAKHHEAGVAWLEAIRLASERVAALVAASPAPERAATHAPPLDLAPALDLLRHERFADALHFVREAHVPCAHDPDIMLLEAILLVHNGELAAAEATCVRLLLIDERNAGAHYVLALCAEHASNQEQARERYRIAAHLDPSFAMPRLHLGLMARRAEDYHEARRELAQAHVLLRGEDASRLLLFGGGFGRETLIILCESTLRECGGRP